MNFTASTIVSLRFYVDGTIFSLNISPIHPIRLS